MTRVQEEAKPPSESQMDYRKLRDLLEGFVDRKCEEYPEELDSVVRDTARTGTVRLPWGLLKPLLHYRLEKVLNSAFLGVHSEDDSMPQQLLEQLDNFDNPPFTIQRVCELIAEPLQHYKRREYYMRAMEKNLLVVSTEGPDLTWMKSSRLMQLLEERPREQEDNKMSCDPLSGRKPFCPPRVSAAVHHTSSPTITTTTWTNQQEVTEPSQSEAAMVSMVVARGERKGVTVTKNSTPFNSESGMAGRKRSSSARDDMEEGNEMRTVLQEADSTVNIEQPHVECMEESPQKKLRDSCAVVEPPLPSLKLLLSDGASEPEQLADERTHSGSRSTDCEHLERDGDGGSSDEMNIEADCKVKACTEEVVHHEHMETS